MLERVVNSGNCGAESGALAAAWSIDLMTGGCIPPGFKTSCGEKPSLKMFGLKELPDSKFSDCLRTNIDNTDGTICFIKNIKELGKAEDFARDHCYKTAKPILNISTDNPLDPVVLRTFIEENKVKNLHVTGMIDKKEEKEIHGKVYKYMRKAFNELRLDRR